MVAMVMPLSDGMDIHFTSLHKILRNLYDQMTPRTDDIATFATAVAGLGALLYISYRVWQALARADAIDVFSLLRPFVIGLCIIGFRPIVVNSINGILKPLVVGTNHILKDQLLDMKELQKKKDRLEWEEAVRRKTYGVIDPNEDYDAELRALGLDVPTQSVMDTLYEVTHIFSTKYWVLQLFRWLLEILFGAAALVIDTLRTFYLVILTILGPIAFAISIGSSSISTISAASIAASEPIAPMAIPMSALVRTGASLIPSPTNASFAFSDFLPSNSSTFATLSDGSSSL